MRSACVLSLKNRFVAILTSVALVLVLFSSSCSWLLFVELLQWCCANPQYTVVYDSKPPTIAVILRSVPQYLTLEPTPFPHTLTIVNTPGLEGREHDKHLAAQIEHFFSIPGGNGIAHIHGIGFVAQASLARLTPTQRYVLTPS